MSTLWEILHRFGMNFVWWTIVSPWEGAIRVRLGKNVTKLGPGLHFKIPHADTIYRQTIRLRISTLQLQTLTSRDGKAITICATVGYSVGDIEKLYNTLHHAEESIRNIAAGLIAETVRNLDLFECDPSRIEKKVNEAIDLSEYGIEKVNLTIIDFAIVKTYRIIQDQHWMSGDELNTSHVQNRGPTE